MFYSLSFFLVHILPFNEQPLKMVRPYEPWVAVLLQQQPVNVGRGVVKRVPRPTAQTLRDLLGGGAVDVNLARSARR